LPPGDYRQADADVRRLKVRVRPSGLKTFIYDYQLPGQPQRTVQVGPVGMRIAKARKVAAAMEARVRLGGDPARSRDEARAKTDDTFAAVMQRYLAFQKHELRPGSYENAERYLRHAAALHSRRLHEITLREVAATVGALKLSSKRNGNGNATRNKVGAAVSALFAWAMGQGIVESNPCIGLTKFALRSRDRVLSPAELRDVWCALPDSDYGRILKLLLLTAARANEIAGLRRTEIQGDGIALPGERTKNGRAHYLPLAPAAHAIVTEQLARQRPDRE
jgi:integrase